MAGLSNAKNLALPYGVTLPEVNSLSIEFNGHMAVYETANEFYADDDAWVSPEEKEKAIAGNSVWRVQWYDLTPVGFYVALASTLEAALKAIASARS